MDNSLVEEQEIETVFIKTEVLDPEDDSYFHEEQNEAYTEAETQTLKCAAELNSKEDCHGDPLNTVAKTRHKQDKIKLFKCGHLDCGKIFKSTQKLNDHVAGHSDTKPFKCKHEGCTKWFKRKNDLYGHMKVHTNEKPFTCSHEGCGKSFKARNTLTAHLRLHSGFTPFKCTHQGCLKAFKRRSHLKSHEATHLRKAKPKKVETDIAVCDVPDCNSMFPTKNRSYYKHMERHNLGKRFRCSFEDCDAEFYEKRDLDRHNRMHTGDRFVCDFAGCDRSYLCKATLTVHQETHSGAVFACSYENCTKMFKTSKILREHLNRHLKKNNSIENSLLVS